MEHKNVLIVDDDDYTRELVQSFLDVLPLTVHQAPEGFSAIDDLDEKNIDILILDVSMPFIDGFKLLEILKRNGRLEHMSVLMLTGSSKEEDIVKASKYGITNYIVKPAKRDDFLERISRIMHEREQDLALTKLPHQKIEVEFNISFNIESMSPWGVTFSSSIGLPQGFKFNELNIPFLKKGELETLSLQVSKAGSDSSKKTIYFLSFFNLPDDKRDDLCRRILEFKNNK